MMDQTHIGYTGWNQPPVNVMPDVMDAPTVTGARLGVYGEGSAEAATTPHRIDLPAFDNVNRQVRTFELAPLWSGPVAYTVRTSAPWIVVSHAAGTITKDTAVDISIDWTRIPPSGGAGLVTVTTPGTAEVALKVQALVVKHPRGHVESGGVIAIEAMHATSWHQANQLTWHILRGFGETLGGVEAYPSLAEPTLPPTPQACLEYDFTALSAAKRTVEFVLAPTLPFDASGRLRFSAALDSAPQQVLNVWDTPGRLAVGSANDKAWAKAVVDGVRRVEWKAGDVSAGVHNLRVCRVDAGVALERMMIYQGARPMEYLGPAESTVAPRGRRTSAEGGGAQAAPPPLH